jgi:Zn-finger nucleic acid-binding protein
MICPKCSGNLSLIETEGIELDYCTHCHGVGFDQGEVTAYFGLAQDVPEETGRSLGRTKALDCPKCKDGLLYEIQYCSVSPLMIDLCDTCQFIWLDTGEVKDLKQLVSKLQKPQDVMKALIAGIRKHLKEKE